MKDYGQILNSSDSTAERRATESLPLQVDLDAKGLASK